MHISIKNSVLILCFGFSLLGFTQQDSIANAYAAKKNAKELQEEQRGLNFKKFFFEALQHKAIGNFDKAISALEMCQNIKNDDKAVHFELGKNYFETEQFFEAETYTKKALDKAPNNLFMLLLLKKIYNKQSNFKDALEVQKKIAQINQDSQLDLVILYIKNNQIDNAKQLLIDLEKKGTLADNLIPFKESLLQGQVVQPVENNLSSIEKEQTVETLMHAYNTEKSYPLLKQILSKLNEKKSYVLLQKESKQGLELFPAQPFVYLMNAKALNQMKKYQEALSILLNGLDYIIDNQSLEAEFYEQLSLSYKGLGQNTEAAKFYKKATVLRQKKS